MTTIAIAASILSAAGLAAAQNSSGSFSFLTMNVAGLPAILNSNDVPGDKGDNANTIGSIFAAQDYDVIHVQEDFSYHAYIYETDDHPYRTPTSGTVPFGDGLNTIANYPWLDNPSFQRVKWDQCYINEGDCLTPKGFSYMRMSFDDGVEVDFYNLHADAGSDSGDYDARAAGVDQLLTYIESASVGYAVVVAGDTNDRYTNSGRSISDFADAGFSDAWVEMINGGVYPTEGATADACGNPADDNTCEVVDKILYRSGDSVTLTATSFDYVPEVFVQSDGNILSDHNPLLVNFAWTA